MWIFYSPIIIYFQDRLLHTNPAETIRILTSPCPSITPQVTGQREDAASPLPASGAGPPRLPVGRAEVTSARYHGDGGAGSGGRDSGGLCYAGSYLTGPGADTQQIHG